MGDPKQRLNRVDFSGVYKYMPRATSIAHCPASRCHSRHFDWSSYLVLAIHELLAEIEPAILPSVRQYMICQIGLCRSISRTPKYRNRTQRAVIDGLDASIARTGGAPSVSVESDVVGAADSPAADLERLAGVAVAEKLVCPVIPEFQKWPVMAVEVTVSSGYPVGESWIYSWLARLLYRSHWR